MPEIMVDSSHRKTMDDMIRLIRDTIDKWPITSKAVFFLKFTQEFKSVMKQSMDYIKKG